MLVDLERITNESLLFQHVFEHFNVCSNFQRIVNKEAFEQIIKGNINRSNFLEFDEECVSGQMQIKAKSLEDEVLDKLLIEQIMSIIASLPEAQKRRFIMRNVLGLTYPVIGRVECCSARSVKDSVDIATRKIQKVLNL